MCIMNLLERKLEKESCSVNVIPMGASCMCGELYVDHDEGTRGCPNGISVFKLAHNQYRGTCLDTVCTVCGHRFGLHKLLGNKCPILDCAGNIKLDVQGIPIFQECSFSTKVSDCVSHAAFVESVIRAARNKGRCTTLYLGKATFRYLVNDASTSHKWGNTEDGRRKTYRGLTVFVVNANTHAVAI